MEPKEYFYEKLGEICAVQQIRGRLPDGLSVL
jgi:hypothetical protein